MFLLWNLCVVTVFLDISSHPSWLQEEGWASWCAKESQIYGSISHLGRREWLGSLKWPHLLVTDQWGSGCWQRTIYLFNEDPSLSRDGPPSREVHIKCLVRGSVYYRYFGFTQTKQLGPETLNRMLTVDFGWIDWTPHVSVRLCIALFTDEQAAQRMCLLYIAICLNLFFIYVKKIAWCLKNYFVKSVSHSTYSCH